MANEKTSDTNYFMQPKDLVTVTKMNHMVEVQYMEKMNTTNHIKKLDKNRYVDLGSGEIKEFNHSVTRKDNYNSLRQTFKKVRYLINNNFVGAKNELHVTLTYAENMTDTKRLYVDFKYFVERLRTRFKDVSTLDYMCVVEPQSRGAWHCHMLVRFNDVQKIYIPNSELEKVWGHGFIKIKSLEGNDNIGAYLSAYLADLDIDDEMSFKTLMTLNDEKLEVQIKTVEGKEKKFVKGGRLHMYPPGMNLYRKSKGIVFPEREKMTYQNIKKIVGSANPHYEKTYKVEKEDFENTIHYQQYNLKRQ